jgi:ribonuclease HI
MEMIAAIEALKALKTKCKVHLTTDSSYLKDGISGWIMGWKKNGWRTKEKSLVKNIDLWMELDQLINKHQVEWFWVKGHAGHKENEIADQLAQSAIKKYLVDLGIKHLSEPDIFQNH